MRHAEQTRAEDQVHRPVHMIHIPYSYTSSSQSPPAPLSAVNGLASANSIPVTPVTYSSCSSDSSIKCPNQLSVHGTKSLQLVCRLSRIQSRTAASPLRLNLTMLPSLWFKMALFKLLKPLKHLRYQPSPSATDEPRRSRQAVWPSSGTRQLGGWEMDVRPKLSIPIAGSCGSSSPQICQIYALTHPTV